MSHTTNLLLFLNSLMKKEKLTQRVGETMFSFSFVPQRSIRSS